MKTKFDVLFFALLMAVVATMLALVPGAIKAERVPSDCNCLQMEQGCIGDR